MISRDQVSTLRRGAALDPDGKRIGSVGEVYLDDDSGDPSWITVAVGFLGTSEVFVPLDGAELVGTDARLPFHEEVVRSAPSIDAGDHLDVEHEDALRRHYGVDALSE